MSAFTALTNIYHPITATPFERSAAYTEIEPCSALKPYIRCFWGTPRPVSSADFTVTKPSLVIPDTCMDIIFNFDYTHNTFGGHFCALDERSYSASAMRESDFSLASTFAIRFYAWTAVLFSENALSESKNQVFEVQDHFSKLKKELEPMLMSVTSLKERAEFASGYLLKCLNVSRQNQNLMNAVFDIVNTRGTMKISDLSAHNALSKRQLERIFNENMGVSPKVFSSLVRYQMLWQELCFGNSSDMLDLTSKYGYFDQAHLLNEFKQRHSMTPSRAILFARS